MGLGGPSTRRLTNQCFFTKLLVGTTNDDSSAQVVSATLAEPWATLLAEELQADMIHSTTNPDHDL